MKEDTTSIEEKYYSTEEVLKLLHISKTTLLRFEHSGKIKCIHVTERTKIYPESEIQKLLTRD